MKAYMAYLLANLYGLYVVSIVTSWPIRTVDQMITMERIKVGMVKCTVEIQGEGATEIDNRTWPPITQGSEYFLRFHNTVFTQYLLSIS